MEEAARLEVIMETCAEVLKRLHALNDAADPTLIADVERLRAVSQERLRALQRASADNANPP